MEKRNVPTVILVTDAFAEFAEALTKAWGKKNARLAVIPHPLGGLDKDKVSAKAAAAMKDIVKGWLEQP